MFYNYLGIDPGQSGGAALLDSEGRHIDAFKFKNMTDHDIAEALREWTGFGTIKCLVEKVHAMPKQGVSSTFNFGRNFGFLVGCLTSLQIPFDFVTPNKWQTALQCQTKGNKNITKAKAQRMFPTLKITHALADALLIAVYCRNQNLN